MAEDYSTAQGRSYSKLMAVSLCLNSFAVSWLILSLNQLYITPKNLFLFFMHKI